MNKADTIKAAIRDVPDFPKPGIMFKDITPILQDPGLFRCAVDLYCDVCKASGATAVAAIEARGFIFAGAVCERLGLGLVPVRKKGKLPYHTYEQSYDLEYGSATLAVHRDAFKPGARVAVLDDLLATGGTAAATAKLVEMAGGKVVALAFLIELAFLGGRAKLSGYPVHAPVVF
jgi:adenine phosphoribosyltransferase